MREHRATPLRALLDRSDVLLERSRRIQAIADVASRNLVELFRRNDRVARRTAPDSDAPSITAVASRSSETDGGHRWPEALSEWRTRLSSWH